MSLIVVGRSVLGWLSISRRGGIGHQRRVAILAKLPRTINNVWAQKQARNQ